jgi:hypothetical protein
MAQSRPTLDKLFYSGSLQMKRKIFTEREARAIYSPYNNGFWALSTFRINAHYRRNIDVEIELDWYATPCDDLIKLNHSNPTKHWANFFAIPVNRVSIIVSDH